MIQSPWRFCTYIHASGRCEVQATVDGGTDELRANAEVAISYLKSQPKQGWRRPGAAKLIPHKKGAFRDFYEIRFKAGKVQQRPIGYFGPGSTDFAILLWAIEKGNRLIPEDWHEISTRRMKEIQEGKASVRDLTFPTAGQASEAEQEGLP